MEAALWIVTTVGAVFFLVGYGVFILVHSIGGRVRKTVRCPLGWQPAEVVFVSDFFETDHYEDVVECSMFGRGQPVLCSKACLELRTGQEESRSAA